MCGIVGIRRFDGRPIDEGLLRTMAAPIEHRGPDGEGYLTIRNVGFGHKRLSIIDLAGSPQPMTSHSGPVHVTYNGEIFNYRELRKELASSGVELVTKGDTEVLLELCRTRGTAGLEVLNGQFAFAIFDERSDQLWLARDRLGILPLYYYWDGKVFAFASEVKSLLAMLGTPPEVDEEALENYLIYRSVPPPGTLFKSIHKLGAGRILQVDGRGNLRESTYWKIPSEEPVRDGAIPFRGEAALQAVEQCLEQSVRLRLEADVPVGAYLSGGLDSSLTTALMKKARNGGEVETFSAGFADPRFDELPYARQVSEALSTNHHEILVSAEDFAELWSDLTWHRDGPISEPADVAIFKIATQARSDVKVLLSGEGADELFAGYPKHVYDPKTKWLWRIPGPLRRSMFRWLERKLPISKARARIAARAMTARSAAERIQTWFAPFTWYERQGLRQGFGSLIDPGQFDRCRGDLLHRMLYVDCHTWLSDNLLERGDRMSMGASIENRPPFLDHHLVELAFHLDSSMKVRNGETKWVVREIARKHLPKAIIDRKKVGFRVPLDEWFRGSLKDMAHDLLLGNDSFVSGYLAKPVIQALLDDHAAGRRDENIRIWTLLGLEVWHRRFMRQSAAQPAPTVASPL